MTPSRSTEEDKNLKRKFDEIDQLDSFNFNYEKIYKYNNGTFLSFSIETDLDFDQLICDLNDLILDEVPLDGLEKPNQSMNYSTVFDNEHNVRFYDDNIEYELLHCLELQ